MAQNDIVPIGRGETLLLEFAWEDQKGALVNLTGATPSIFQCYPANLAPFYEVTMFAPEQGRIRLLLPANRVASSDPDAPPEQLELGPRNWVRIRVDHASGSTETSPKLGIDVQ